MHGQRTDIQGLRAVAIGLVLADHLRLPGLPGGYIGVDVFFVISGYLITSQMLRSTSDGSSIDLGDFYARRIRRILPASVVVAMASLVIGYATLPPLQWERAASDAIWTLLYVPNIAFALAGTNYLSNSDPSLYQHYWSLGVEEQFYLVWPLAFIVVYRLARRRLAVVGWALALGTFVSLALCIVLTTWKQPIAFFLLPTRAWELGIGSLLAFAPQLVMKRRPAQILRSAGIVIIIATALVLDHRSTFPGALALLPTVGAAMVIAAGAWAPEISSTSWLLGNRWMRFTGDISYSLYLVHWPLVVIATASFAGPGEELSGRAAAIIGVVCFILAWVLYRTIETPFRQMGTSRSRGTGPAAGRPWPVFATAGIATTLSVTIALSAGALGSARSLDAGRIAAPGIPKAPPAATDFVPSNLEPSLRRATEDNPLIYASGCHLDFSGMNPDGCSFGPRNATRSYAIFGDSHAAQWLPAAQNMAETYGASLENHTKSSCPPVFFEKLNLGGRYTECEIWVRSVVDHLVKNPVDIVLLGAFRSSNQGTAVLSEGESFEGVWNRGLSELVSELSQVSTVLLIADTPSWDYDPPTCLSAHIGNTSACSQRRSDVLEDELALSTQYAAVRAAGGEVVDLTNYLCGSDCPMIENNILMYRDQNHITATFSAALASAFDREVRAAAARAD